MYTSPIPCLLHSYNESRHKSLNSPPYHVLFSQRSRASKPHPRTQPWRDRLPQPFPRLLLLLLLRIHLVLGVHEGKWYEHEKCTRARDPQCFPAQTQTGGAEAVERRCTTGDALAEGGGDYVSEGVDSRGVDASVLGGVGG